MADSSESRPFPWWVTTLDGIACVLLVLAVSAFVTGTGPHGHIAGIRISLTSEERLSIAAACLIAVRHLVFRRPTLLDRLRPAWPAARLAVESFVASAAEWRPKDETRASRWLWPLLVVVLFCVPLFVGLSNTDVQNDEAIYSFAVDTMVQSGDWLTPKSIPFEHEPFVEKPPLKFWIVAAPIRLGLLPHNEFGLRFWDALFGGVAFLYVFAIGRSLAGPLCGAIAVLILFTEQPLIFDHGLRGNNMEAPLVLCYCAGVYHFLAWRSSESSRRRYAHIFALALYVVLGFMTKFVAALFLPAVLGAAVLAGRDLGRFWRDRGAWLAAAMLALALIAPWFIYQDRHLGNDFWRIILGQHVFTRFTSYLDPAHVQPWHYYFSEIFGHFEYVGSAPIIRAGLVLLLVGAVRGWWKERLILLWFALPVVLMSLGTSKLFHYTYPFLPPLALAGGYIGAVAFRFGWSVMNRPWRPVQRVLAETNQRTVRQPHVRVGLLVAAAVAIAVAIGTYVAGDVRLRSGAVVLLDNATLTRPALIAILALILAGRLIVAVRLTLVLLLLFMLPSSELYRQELVGLSSEQHPIRSMRACLEPISADLAGGKGHGAGVWVADDQLTWPLCYYLRGLGPWEKQDTGPDATAYMHLYAPGRLRPVILSYPRYDSFMKRVRAGDPLLIEEAARNAGIDPRALAATASSSMVMPVRFPDGVLLLPGRYAACAVPQRAGS